MTSKHDLDGHIAYFSMEFGLENGMNTYNGGLGILAGDVMRAFADLDVPALGVMPLNDLGLCKQTLDEDGTQECESAEWDPEEYCEELSETATMELDGEEITIGAWRYDVESDQGGTVPVIMLDTNREENSEWAQELTRRVYAGTLDRKSKIAQEMVLGIGGLRVLEALDYDVDTYHLNEGHACFLALELLKRNDLDPEPVREQTVFTTHTPVAAAHERFEYDRIEELLGDYIPIDVIQEYATEDVLHTTHLALNLTRYVNGVAKRHQWVSHNMFPDHVEHIDAITNGVHVPTWIGDHMQELFDYYMEGFDTDPYKLMHATLIGPNDLWEAHQKQKREFVDYVEEQSGVELDPEVFTIGFARRAVPYKRATLLFRDAERLQRIADEVGELQVVYAGKAFPGDGLGKDLIREVISYKDEFDDNVTVTYLPDYDMEMGLQMTAGVDLWLNNPHRPREACGTSGMKAAMNGVPQLSTLDGWWVEGHIEGETGWAIGPAPFDEAAQGLSDEEESDLDANSIYEHLEHDILPLYYEDRDGWVDVMKKAIAFNGSRYPAVRMVQEYLFEAY